MPTKLLSKQEINDRIVLLGSIIQDRNAIYCSAPITSGKRFYDWLVRMRREVDIDQVGRTLRSRHAKQVIEPNVRRARAVARLLRRRGHLVIDPTTVGPTTWRWRQGEWRLFWENVIERYVKRVVLVDGWEYSNGCVHEFWVASRSGIPAYDEQGKRITLTRARSLIRKALADVQNSTGNATFLRRTLKSIAAARANHR